MCVKAAATFGLGGICKSTRKHNVAFVVAIYRNHANQQVAHWCGAKTNVEAQPKAEVQKAHQTSHTNQDMIKSESESENSDDPMLQLSRGMSKFLKYTAHTQDLLDDDGWLLLADALPWLDATSDGGAKAVASSDRHPDKWGLGPRFELLMSGSRTWVCATNGQYYRERAHGKRTLARHCAVRNYGKLMSALVRASQDCTGPSLVQALALLADGRAVSKLVCL
jgi:hypothetical protein